MSYTAFKTVHAPTGVECCGAAYLTQCPGEIESATEGWIGSTAGPEFGWYTATTPCPGVFRGNFWSRVDGNENNQEADELKEGAGWVLPNLVVTRANVLEVYIVRSDVKENPADAASAQANSGGAGVEGQTKRGALMSGLARVWLEIACEYRLHGNVESLAVLTHRRDEGRWRRDALILAFREAKVAVLDFDDATHSLQTSSLHYYEGPEWEHLKRGREVFARGPAVRTDPQGRCAAMVVYGVQMVVFKAVQVLFGLEEEEERFAETGGRKRNAAIESSYVVNLREFGLRHIRDFVFLYGYIEPTVLLLHEDEPTWSGRAATKPFTCSIAALSINTSLRQHPLIWSATGLPYDACKVVAVPAPIGGVVVFAANSLHYHSQNSFCVLALNDFAVFPDGSPPAAKSKLNVELDAAQVTWIANNTALISTKVGDLLLLSLAYDGRGVQSLELTKSKGSVLCSCACTLGDSFFFLGSRLADSLLVQYTSIKGNGDAGTAVELASGTKCSAAAADTHEQDVKGTPVPVGEEQSSPKQTKQSMSDLSIDSSGAAEELSLYQTTPGSFSSSQRKAFTYEVRDSLINIGPLRDFAYGRRPNFDAHATGLAKQSNFQLVACSGYGKNGSLSVLQRSIRPELITEVELPGCQGIWTVYHMVEEEGHHKEGDPGVPGIDVATGADGNGDEQFHSYLILSMESQTMVLETGEFLGEVTEKVEYYTKGRTIAVGNIFNRRRVVQIYSQGVRLLNGAVKSDELTFGDSADQAEAGKTGPVSVAEEKSGDAIEAVEGGACGEQKPDAAMECRKDDNILISTACVLDPFILLTMTDGSLRLVIGDSGKMSLRLTKPLISGDDKNPVTACTLYHDPGPYPWLERSPKTNENEQSSSKKVLAKQTSKKYRLLSSDGHMYCVACRRSGELQMYRLPEFALVFSAEGFQMGKRVLMDRGGLLDGENLENRVLKRIIEQGEGGNVEGKVEGGEVVTKVNGSENLESPEEKMEATSLKEAEAVKKEVDDVKAESEDVNMEIDGVKKEVDGVNEASDVVKEEPDLAKEEPDVVKMEIDGSKMEVDGLKMEVDGLKMEVDGLKMEVDGCIQDAEAEVGEAPDVNVNGGEGEKPISRRGRKTVEASQEIGTIFVREICMATLGEKCGRPFLIAIRSDGVMLCYHAFSYGGGKDANSEFGGSVRPSENGHCENADPNDTDKEGGARAKEVESEREKVGDSNSVLHEKAAITLSHLRFKRKPINWVPCEGDVFEPEKGCNMVCFRNVGDHRGVFVTGVRPMWLMALRGRLRPHLQLCDQGITAFTPLHNVNCDHGFIYLTSEGVLKICQLPPYLSYDSDWPVQKIPLRVTPHHIAYHPDANVYALVTSSVVTRTLYQALIPTPEGLSAPAGAGDGDGGGAGGGGQGSDDDETMVEVEEYELRIIMPGGNWESKQNITLHLMENALTSRIVSLKNTKTEQQQTLLAVGTAFVHGEDVAGKGRILLYNLVDPGEGDDKSWVEEVYAKELKGAISAVAAVQGKILIAVGPKIILHTWDGEELHWAGFFDAPLYVVSLNTVKNFVLLGDIHKSIYFLCWKEEENQLKLLAKDFGCLDVYATEFLIDGGILSLLVTDSHKNLQVFSFLPKSVESWKGQKLLPRAEFHMGANAAKLLRLPMLPIASAPRTNRAAVLFGTLDGGVNLVAPVDELTFRRLQTLQSRLVYALPHAAGLNPASFRKFKSPGTALRPGPQNIIDCDLIAHYEMMELSEQVEIARQCGTTRTQIISNLRDIVVCTSFF